jgi:hypothetical protein
MEGTDRRAHQHGRALHGSPRSTGPPAHQPRRARALLVLPYETQITNDFENRSSSHEENDYVQVSGVNAESRRLTAGGCCLLSSRRFIAGTLPVKRPYIKRDRGLLGTRPEYVCPCAGRRNADGDWPVRDPPEWQGKILINLKVAIPLTTGIRLGQNPA